MAIVLYNSLTRNKEEFKPLKPPSVNIYACGVTVYDLCHLGHGRSLFFFELLRRYLGHRGFKVRFVRNITDIDDKIIIRARDLNTTWQDVANRYIDSYYADLEFMQIPKADVEPRATENIPAMIDYIKRLISLGYAYTTPTGVYFCVKKFSDYGKLSAQSPEQMLKGVRKEPDETKHEHLDFALWKISKPDEPGWDSPWGRGRPGWHIECSVMAQKYLGVETLDIHGGGMDLIFPHHENELAQSQAVTNKPLARYWIHHGLLTINSQKMAKSLGNFITIKDFQQRYRDPNLLKMFFLSAHYRTPLDYTEEKMQELKSALRHLTIIFERARNFSNYQVEDKPLVPVLDKQKEDFFAALDDDLNTPQALASVYQTANLAARHIEDPVFVLQAAHLIKEQLLLLGIRFDALNLPLSKEEIEEKIRQRQQARQRKDYKLADSIREELLQAGIVLEDTREGTLWRRLL